MVIKLVSISSLMSKLNYLEHFALPCILTKFGGTIDCIVLEN